MLFQLVCGNLKTVWLEEIDAGMTDGEHYRVYYHAGNGVMLCRGREERQLFSQDEEKGRRMYEREERKVVLCVREREEEKGIFIGVRGSGQCLGSGRLAKEVTRCKLVLQLWVKTGVEVNCMGHQISPCEHSLLVLRLPLGTFSHTILYGAPDRFQRCNMKTRKIQVMLRL